MGPAAFPVRSFVVEADDLPPTLIGRFQRLGLVGAAGRLGRRHWVEPLVSLQTLVRAFRLAGVGVEVEGLRPRPVPGSWRDEAVSASKARRRLRDLHCAEWLPTLPAA